jgi:hypothetical protein
MPAETVVQMAKLQADNHPHLTTSTRIVHQVEYQFTIFFLLIIEMN